MWLRNWPKKEMMNKCCNVLIVIIAFCCVFVNTNMFTDSQMLPKWMCLFIGASLLFVGKGAHALFAGNKSCKCHFISVFWGFSLICVAQALYALIGYEDWLHNKIVIGIGSFENVAGFSSCLCGGVPFVLLWLNVEKWWCKVLGMVGLLLIMLAIIVCNSRTALVSVGMMAFFLFVHGEIRLGNRRTQKIFGGLLLIFLIVGICVICKSKQKQNSANGRMLVWRVACEMINDKPVLGHGMNGVEREYMLYQARYLREYADKKEMYVADNVKHVFNDYLGFAVQFGLLGVILLVFLLVYIMRC